MISVVVVVLSCALTAAMSLLFNHQVRPDMMATGFVSAVVINHVVGRVTRSYRRRLRMAHEMLERRVLERTAELETANEALRDAAVAQRELRDELMIRDRMATAGMVAAGVSHEIRSPLTVIKMAIDEVQHLIARSPDDQLRELATDIVEATDRITTILRDLSSIARPIDDPLGPVELKDVIDSASRLASYKFGKGVTLERGAIDVPPVRGNTSRLVQLITNLLHNAARATRSDVPNTIRIAATATLDTVELTISDTGTGMSTDTRARLFEPFFTTGHATGGTGLGLVICKSIVERMGGSIDIASELGRGTTVAVSLRRLGDTTPFRRPDSGRLANAART